MEKISDIISAIEAYAPLHLQEGYDNCGLQVGDGNAEATGVLLCVDVTEAVVDEAIALGVNMVVSHHPLIFRGLKKLVGRSDIERIVIKAIKNDIAIYSAHTNMDNTRGGVSARMAQKLGLKNVRVLVPQVGRQVKVVVYVPTSYADAVADAMHACGAGNIGDYEHCSYRIAGEGRYRAKAGAHPFVGTPGEMHSEPETRIEVIAHAAAKDRVVQAMLQAHPYEEPAYDVLQLQNESPYEGAGVVGDIEATSATDFLAKLKNELGVDAVRIGGDATKTIRRVALCGGSGAEFIGAAVHSGADIYVTGDVKYHDFTGNASRILIADIGHYESEQFTKDIFYEIIREKMPNFATYYAKSEKKKVKFFI